jgi:hypothetical protein
LTSNNTVVKKGTHEGLYFTKYHAAQDDIVAAEHVYVFQPHSKTRTLRTASFEIKFIIGNDNDDDAQSRANAEETEKWIEFTILPMEHNTNVQESLQVEQPR